MSVKCYYETLNVSQDASDEDIKKSYRKLALQWHPDKNLDNLDEAKEQFQLVQQAYEVLSDPQERAWYDKHRDSILKGGLGKDYNDNSLNLYPYFTTSCFKGYGDDEKGFYFIYREVFNKISAEDSQFDDDLDSDDEIPNFGDSQTPYEDEVHAFYTYWQSYSTKKSFSWLDEFDTRTAPNRRISRLMEKENKKIRDAARKGRNEQVRTLVAFVRKRDKRVEEYAKVLEQRASLIADKVKVIKLKQQQERREEIERQIKSQSEWSKFSNFEEELKVIEENLAAEFNEELSEEWDSQEEEEEEEEDVYSGNLYCSACNKMFKTPQAFVNHEKSKKHREKVEEITFDDDLLETPGENDDIESENDQLVNKDNIESEELNTSDAINSLPEIEEIINPSKRNKKKKKNKMQLIESHSTDSEHEDVIEKINSDSDEEIEIKKPKNKRNKRKTANKNPSKNESSIVVEQEKTTSDSNTPGVSDSAKSKNHRKKTKPVRPENPTQKLQQSRNDSDNTAVESNEKTVHICKACTIIFKSNNELFKHLRKTGHALPITPREPLQPLAATSKSKKKSKNM